MQQPEQPEQPEQPRQLRRLKRINIKIAFGSKARVGKDTACNYMKDRFGAEVLRFAESVYEIGRFIQVALGKTPVKDPALLQWIGMGVRNHYGEDVWVDKLESTYTNFSELGVTSFAVPDMRFPNEFARLRDLGFTCIKIDREKRPIDRDPNHPSEIGLDSTSIPSLDNNYNVKHLFLQLNYIIYQMTIHQKVEQSMLIHLATVQMSWRAPGTQTKIYKVFQYAEFGSEYPIRESLHRIMFNRGLEENGSTKSSNFTNPTKSPHGDETSNVCFSDENFSQFLGYIYNEKITVRIYNNLAGDPDVDMQILDMKGCIC